MKFSVGASFGHCGGSARGVRLTLRLCHVGDAELVCGAMRFLLARLAFGLRSAMRFCCRVSSSVHARRCGSGGEIPPTRAGHCGSAAGWFAVVHAVACGSVAVFCLRSRLTSQFCCGVLPSFTPDFAALLR